MPILINPRFASLLLAGCVSALRPAPRVPRAAPAFGDPLGLQSWRPAAPAAGPSAAPVVAAALPLLAAPSAVSAVSLSQAQYDPASFSPVCPASDGFYRFGQASVVALVGDEAYKEYAPLIAGGLLRVRLELCVVESFFYEAIIPFIKENGISWVLPLHETVETFLAGVIFAVATNFILIGSTKIISVVVTYGDIIFGFPLRTIGGVGWRNLEDRQIGAKEAVEPPEPRPWWKGPKPREAPPIEEIVQSQWGDGSSKRKAELVVWGGMFGAGKLSERLRESVEAVDLFVGRYLLIWTVAYVGFKFVHFKIFDPFPM